jgi:hypothetical protein
MFLNLWEAPHCWDLMVGWLGRKVSKLQPSINEYYCTKLVHIHFFEYEKLCFYWLRPKASKLYLPCLMGVNLTVSDIKGITQSFGKNIWTSCRRKLRTNEIHNMYSSLNIIRVTKSTKGDANRFLGLKRAYTGRLPGKGVYNQQCKLQ